MDVHKEYTTVEYLNGINDISPYNIVITVNSDDESEHTQKLLFSFGFNWPIHGNTVLYYRMKYIKAFIPSKELRYGFDSDTKASSKTIKIFTFEQFKASLIFNEL